MTKMTNMKRRGYIYKHMMQVIDAYIYSTVSLYPTLLIHRIGEKSESNYKTIKEFFFFFCFSIGVFVFDVHSRSTGQQGKGLGIYLTPLYHFHPLHRGGWKEKKGVKENQKQNFLLWLIKTDIFIVKMTYIL